MAIVFLEVFGLVVLAQKCGVDIVVQIIDKIIDGWSQNNSK
ncbi:hypothetical protein [Nitrosomonas sp. Nm33]|nr:hypothetical protein [Nitrosomonas sp. Nm33]